jgi:hypothetical protein
MKKLVTNLSLMLALGACLSLSACVFVRASSISESAGGGSAINTEYSDYGWLYLTAPTNITAAANTALAGQCQTGHLTDVQTELSMRDWFIIQYYTVNAAAVCK